MATSTELKSRLRKFLADPKAEDEFRYWFASLLTQNNDPDLEALAHAIDSAFSDAADGHCTPQELRTYLSDLARAEKTSTASTAGVYDLSELTFYYSTFSSPLNPLSASGAFYGHNVASAPLSYSDKAQPNAWETLVVPAEDDQEESAA